MNTFSTWFEGFDSADMETPVVEYHDEACYADLFYPIDYYAADDRRDAKFDVLRAYYWLRDPCTSEDADWYLEKFVLKHIPARIPKDCFKYFKDPDKIPERLVQKDRKMPNERRYWVTLEVDLKRISATDLYLLLMLSRYPQENPRVPASMLKHVKQRMRRDLSFLLCHLHDVDTGYGHLVFHSSTPYVLVGYQKGKFKNYSFKKLWDSLVEQTGVHARPYTEVQNKLNINNHFRVQL